MHTLASVIATKITLMLKLLCAELLNLYATRHATQDTAAAAPLPIVFIDC